MLAQTLTMEPKANPTQATNFPPPGWVLATAGDGLVTGSPAVVIAGASVSPVVTRPSPAVRQSRGSISSASALFDVEARPARLPSSPALVVEIASGPPALVMTALTEPDAQ
jgi:hypothetical protein